MIYYLSDAVFGLKEYFKAIAIRAMEILDVVDAVDENSYLMNLSYLIWRQLKRYFYTLILGVTFKFLLDEVNF